MTKFKVQMSNQIQISNFKNVACLPQAGILGFDIDLTLGF